MGEKLNQEYEVKLFDRATGKEVLTMETVDSSSISSAKLNNYIYTDNLKPCVVCGNLTCQVGICEEARICSDECMSKMDKDYLDYLERVKDIELE